MNAFLWRSTQNKQDGWSSLLFLLTFNKLQNQHSENSVVAVGSAVPSQVTVVHNQNQIKRQSVKGAVVYNPVPISEAISAKDHRLFRTTQQGLRFFVHMAGLAATTQDCAHYNASKMDDYFPRWVSFYTATS